MSHKAVNWALEQSQLKPAPWIVLIQLADRHNKDTLRCDPAQELLAADCNMSRATVNRHLDTLEGEGFIRRVKRIDPSTKKSLPTFYILGLNFDNPPVVENAVSQNETRVKSGQNENKTDSRVSNCDTEPCLKNENSRVSKNANPVSQNETLTIVNKPVREPCAADAPHHGFDFGSFFDEVWRRFPRKGDWEETQDAVDGLIEAGEAPEAISAAVKSYAELVATYDPTRVKLSQNFFVDDFWKKHIPTAAPKFDQDAARRSIAATIKEGKPFLCRSISAAKAGECIVAGLVTLDECRAAGVAI